MSTPPQTDKSLGEIVSEASEKASLLVREEIELKRWRARAPAMAARHRARGSKCSRRPVRSCSVDGRWDVSH